MHKKFETNRTKIKGSCQSGRKVVTHDSKNDLPLVHHEILKPAQNTTIAKDQLDTKSKIKLGSLVTRNT